jgi:hypothetical protein
MNTFGIALVVAASASLCSAQTTVQIQKDPSKRELAKLTPPATNPLPPAPANGSDDCLNAAANDAISGTGTFPVDTTVATDGGTPSPSCTACHKDVWFQYTATGNGTVTVSACGSTTSDTVIAVWSGAGCPTGTSLACNDDSCGLVSSVNFAVTSGSIYMIECGHFGATAGTTWAINVTLSTTPANDDCAAPQALPGPGTYSFNLTAATTGTQGQTTGGCGPALPFYKDVWYTYPATTNGTADVTTCGFLTPGSPTFDTKIEVFSGTGCPSGPAITCNDDNCTSQALASDLTFPTVCGQMYTIQLGEYASGASISGSLNITETGTPCGPAGTPYCFGDGTGTACPCGNNGAPGNGCASSVNPAGGNLSTSGSPSVSGDTLVLTSTGLPTGACLYFQGTTQLGGGLGVAFGDGLRCTGGTVVRLGTKQNPGGTSSYPVAGDPPIHIKGNDVAGDVRDYQCWYRNAAVFCTPSTFNLTNGIQITWAP